MPAHFSIGWEESEGGEARFPISAGHALNLPTHVVYTQDTLLSGESFNGETGFRWDSTFLHAK